TRSYGDWSSDVCSSDLQQVDHWQSTQLSDSSAKLLIYQAFIEEEAAFPKHLARRVHDLYFQSIHEEFQARTMWSLSNAFTSAFRSEEHTSELQSPYDLV